MVYEKRDLIFIFDYLIINHFKNLSQTFRSLSYDNNSGQWYYLSFCADGSDSFQGIYSGGYPFKSVQDYTINFDCISSCPYDVVINMMFFVPAVVNLNNGSLEEILG